MSAQASSTPTDSPSGSPIQPLHNPSQAAHVSVPQAPVGTQPAPGAPTQQPKPGSAAQALLAKKMAKTNNPKFVSPTDKMMTPVTQKLNAAKQKRFAKGAKPSGALFTQREGGSGSSDEATSDKDADKPTSTEGPSDSKIKHDDDNPF
ncbi:hypothetical protein CONPUDRAFT_102753 [Coniophora puteana RWD-64-598 SS2]|uniref:Uncharacterized protein n=1 Tax=Coniophora puteana (strain RWD-64-598) TaxID=741705 RepID=A0A5M3MSB7_CONPW|nr:uncharacterized protein CONPUDRAFT_102753 [Coniophora puteana RWD-64-598 SS2]EIW82052.1 hypothetical protein CONPUDRAFT_102753 [Coniophora puteana RWD-64-598 SS2]